MEPKKTNNDNADIFICTHKDFDCPVTNNVYKIISQEKIDSSKYKLPVYIDNPEENKLYDMRRSYSEACSMYWIWKNYEIKDYIGINHYRRYFDFMDNVPDFDETFKKYDIIATTFPFNNSVCKIYRTCHNFNDLLLTWGIIHSKYPTLSDSFEKFLFGNKFYACNMFITSRKYFNDLCTFNFSIMEEFTKQFNLKTDEDCLNHANGNEYQQRVLGYLFERLTAFFIYANFTEDKILELPIQITETKYSWENNKSCIP